MYAKKFKVSWYCEMRGIMIQYEFVQISDNMYNNVKALPVYVCCCT